jgi:hypothetical protein
MEMLVIGFLSAIAFDTHHIQNDGMMHHPINGGHSGHGIFEDAIPLAEDQIGRQDDGFAFIALGTLINILQIGIIHSANSFRSRRCTTRSRARCFP